MNLEKVIFGFFNILACTLNFGFFIGDLDRPELHHPFELFSAIVVSLIVTVLKFGDRTQTGARHLATSLVALLQFLAAALVWFFATPTAGGGLNPGVMASIVSFAAGALFANVVSVIILIVETAQQRR